MTVIFLDYITIRVMFFSRHYCMCIHQLMLLQYMFHDGNCILNDQELCSIIHSIITIMLLSYVIILYLPRGGVGSLDYNKLYNFWQFGTVVSAVEREAGVSQLRRFNSRSR